MYGLPQESVGVLIRAPRPCVVEITEVHQGVGGERERDVTRDLGSLVLRKGLGKARAELCDCAPHGVVDYFAPLQLFMCALDRLAAGATRSHLVGRHPPELYDEVERSARGNDRLSGPHRDRLIGPHPLPIYMIGRRQAARP